MKESEKNLRNMLLITKMAIITFVIFIIYINLSQYWINIKLEYNKYIDIFTALLFLGSTVIIYLSSKLVVISIESQSDNRLKLRWFFENILFIMLISLPIHIFSQYDNEYKYIFLLLILCNTIQYGSKYGIATSLLSAVAILNSDLLYAPTKNGVNIFFQKDIILTGVFVAVAWILGYYVDLVINEDKKKESRLDVLNSKLQEKQRQREDIKLMLINNEICYDILFEDSINAVIVHKEGKILYANKSAINLLGYDYIYDSDKKTIYEFYDKKEMDNIRKKYYKIEKEKKSKIIEEEKIIDTFGKSKMVSNISSFFLYKEESSVLSILTDMTNEKKIESLKRDIQKNIKILNDTKEFNSLIRNLFINMSHELKTPVNVMYSAIQAIGVNYDDYNVDRKRLYIKSMKQNCLRMIRLINNFVDATRLEAGELTITRTNVDIVETVESIVQKTAEYVRGKGIDIIFDTNVEERIMSCDKGVIKRILLNLLSNSIKFGFEQEEILINLISMDTYVFIKIRDNGKGIKKSQLNLIFERFGQADNSLSRECEGAGVGLYLVKSFVELHNGTINIKSSEGSGTEVTIKLPAEIIRDSKFSDEIIIESDEEKIEREFSDIYRI